MEMDVLKGDGEVSKGSVEAIKGDRETSKSNGQAFKDDVMVMGSTKGRRGRVKRKWGDVKG